MLILIINYEACLVEDDIEKVSVIISGNTSNWKSSIGIKIEIIRLNADKCVILL